MKEKASLKESGEDQIPRVDPDAPGLPAGEELTIDPVSGDEIDPIKKWWDETEASNREKVRNRRLEELEAGADGILDAEGRALPRRRKGPLPPTIEVDDIPGLTGPKTTTSPVAEEAAVASESSPVDVPEVEEENEALSLDSFPVSPLKRHTREEGEAAAAFDLSDLFATAAGENVAPEVAEAEETAAPDMPEAPSFEGLETEEKAPLSDIEKEDLSLDLGDLLKPATAKDQSALFFEFPDFEDEPEKVPDKDNEVPVVVEELASDVEEPGEVRTGGDDELANLIRPEGEKEIVEPDITTEEKPATIAEPEPEDELASQGAEIPESPEIVADIPKIEAPARHSMPPLPIMVSDDDAETAEPEAKVILPETEPRSPGEPITDSSESVLPDIFSGDSPDEEATPQTDPPHVADEISETNVKDDETPQTLEAASAGLDQQEEKSDTTVEAVPVPVPVEKVVAAAELPVARKKAGCWTVFATLFFFATLLLIAVIGVAGWFAWSRLGDFESEITTRVKSGLEERGVYLDYGDWSYQFPRGLVFDEVTIFDDSTRQRPFIKVAGLGINVDLIGLVKAPGELGAGEINLQDSTVSFFEAGNPVTTIKGLDGEIFASHESIRVEKITAPLGGWQVNLNGIVNLPATGATKTPTAGSAPAEATQAPLTFDFSAFKALEPWLAVGSGNGGESAPVLNLTFSMDADQPDLASIEGSIYGRGMTWHGIDLTSATATFNVIPETGELSVPNFQIGYGDGFIGGKLAVDTATQKLKIEQLQSTVDVFALLGKYKAEWAENWKSIRLVDAPSIQITGEIPFEDPSQADLKVRYDHRAGMVCTFERGELPISDLRGNFTVNRGSIETNDAGFELFGGAVQLNGATRLTNDSRPFNGLIEITGLSLEKAAVFLGGKESGMAGRLSFVFRGVGYADIQKIRGGGTLRVEEAVIPDFPVLGRIQDYAGRAVPAFGVKGQGNLTGAYIIESGVLVASDLTVANSAARIVTNGSVNLSSLETTFTAKADLVPSLAAATGLTDKAITFEGKGPLGEPTVVLKSFPIEFASVSLGSILGTSPRSLGTLQVVPGAKEAIAAFADQLGGPGVTVHPEVTTFFKSLLGEEAAAPEAAPVPATTPE